MLIVDYVYTLSFHESVTMSMYKNLIAACSDQSSINNLQNVLWSPFCSNIKQCLQLWKCTDSKNSIMFTNEL